MIFGIFASPVKFSQAMRNFRKVCEMLYFSGFSFARNFLRFFPSVLKSTCN